MPRPNRLSSLLTLLLLPVALHAATYKWVDENGETQYTQSPPPGDIQAEEIRPPAAVDSAAAQKELDSLQKSLETNREGRETSAKSAADEQALATEKAAKCEQAKQRLLKAERPLTNFVDPDGTQRRATEEERQKQITESQAQVKEFCG